MVDFTILIEQRRKLRLRKVKCHTCDDQAVSRIRTEVRVGGKDVFWSSAIRKNIVEKLDVKSVCFLLYLCGLLNSELLSYYAKINKIIRTGKGKTPQIKISDLKKLPININGKYYTDVIDCVKKLLIEKDRKTYFELNSLVYKIYDISNEEIDAVREYLNLLE